jgi:hypothetical protein
MFAPTLFFEQPRTMQLLQSLRNRGDFLSELLRELRDTVFLIEKPLHQLEALWRTQCLK